MSRIAQLQRELQDVSAAVARAERTVVAHPDVPSVAATLRTILKRKENLEGQFFEVAKELGLDVCGYRIEYEDGPAPIAGMTAVLGGFQKIFTSVYDSLDRRPKLTSKASAETTEATAFGFSYTYPGSIGVMMTLAKNPTLFGEARLDEAMGKTFELMRAADVSAVQALTETLGVPAIRLVHQWAAENVKSGFGADITWRRGDTIKQELVIQRQEIELLAKTIKGMSAREEVTIVGEIRNVDVDDRTFRMSVKDALDSGIKDQTIHGNYDKAITTTYPVQWPKTYRATLHVLQKIVVDDGQEEITYFLLRLDPPEGPGLLTADREAT